MRIAYILADPGIAVGGTKGASIHVAEVCRAFRGSGAEVLLLAMRAAGPAPPEVRMVHVDPGPLASDAWGELDRVQACERFLTQIEPALTEFRPELIYERLALFCPGTAVLAAKLGALRVVEVNAPVAQERSRHFGLVHRSLAESMEWRSLTGATVVAVSEQMARWSAGRGAVATKVIANGVDPHRFTGPEVSEAGAALRQHLGLATSEVVGFAGSLKPWHGVEILLEAIEQLAPRRPSLRLLLVGDGPGRAVCQTRASQGVAKERVVFTGAVEYDSMPAHLAAFDIATAPYLGEDGFYFSPLKIVEAMAAAKPVVASRMGPIEILLGDTGVLVAPGQPAALAQALAALLDDPGQSERLGRAARQRAESSLTWDAVVEKILAFTRDQTFPSRQPLEIMR